MHQSTLANSLHNSDKPTIRLWLFSPCFSILPTWKLSFSRCVTNTSLCRIKVAPFPPLRVLPQATLQDLTGAFGTTGRWRTLFGVHSTEAESSGKTFWDLGAKGCLVSLKSFLVSCHQRAVFPVVGDETQSLQSSECWDSWVGSFPVCPLRYLAAHRRAEGVFLCLHSLS